MVVYHFHLRVVEVAEVNVVMEVASDCCSTCAITDEGITDCVYVLLSVVGACQVFVGEVGSELEVEVKVLCRHCGR